MFERPILSVRTEAPGVEAPALVRDRLKRNFPAGAARRMTLPGLMVGSLLQDLVPTPDDTVVYSSIYGESSALEGYLDSFPTPSPTLFQTSIHPSAMQQGLIGRQLPVRELFPLTGGGPLVAQAALVAVTSPAARVLWCGAEERATWMTERGVAGDRAFAFVLELGAVGTGGGIGRLALEAAGGAGRLALPEWFDLLHERRAWCGCTGNDWRLTLTWL